MPRCAAYGILVPRPGIEPRPPAVEAQSPNHWTTREFPKFKITCCLHYISVAYHLPQSPGNMDFAKTPKVSVSSYT